MKSPDGQFALEVLVAGEPQREYFHSNRTYVESRLDTPATKMVDLTEGTPWGQEQSRWPVTPYQIRAGLTPSATVQACGVRTYVDGVLVDTKVIHTQKPWRTVKGFQQADGSTAEFQFSFPRYARDELDHMDPARLPKLGTISVSFHPASHPVKRNKYTQRTVVNFQQGNKKDAVHAGGNTFMSTTRAGDVISRRPAKMSWRNTYTVDWNTVFCTLELHYRIQRVLQQLGIDVVQRDTAQENRRLFGASFDNAPAGSAGTNAGTNAGSSAGSSAGTNAGSSAGSSEGSSAGPDVKVIKVPKVVELDD